MPEYSVELIERDTGERRAESVFAETGDDARTRAGRDGWLAGTVREVPDLSSTPPMPPALTPEDIRHIRGAVCTGVWHGLLIFVAIMGSLGLIFSVFLLLYV